MSFLALYFYYAYVWKAEKEAVGVIQGVSGGICLLAVLNRFGFWPVDFPGKVGYDAFHYWECELAVRVSVGAAACGDRGVLGKPQGSAERRKMQGRAERQKMAAGGSGAFTAAAFLCTAVQGSDSGFLIIGTALWVLFLISCRDGAEMSAFQDVFLTASGAVFVGLLGLRVFRGLWKRAAG